MTGEQYRAKRVAICHTQSTLAIALGLSRETILRRESSPIDLTREAELAICALGEQLAAPKKPDKINTATPERAPVFGGMLKAPRKS